MIFRLLAFWSLMIGVAAVEPMSLDVRGLGAVGDGVTKDTLAIQRAIDAASAKGGAVVLVPAGRYLVGTLQLRSHVRLHLAADAVLLGSTQAEDYPPVGAMRDGLGRVCDRVLISARDVEEIGISGDGIIDGQRSSMPKSMGIRPFLVRFQSCRKVSVSGVTLRHSAMWCCHLWQSREIEIDRITIENQGTNSDGIDIDASQGVVITNSRITSGDDAICFKSTVNQPCRQVTVSGCTMRTPWNCFKIGTESVGDFEDITMRDCTFEGQGKGGIRIYSVDGANIRRIRIEGMTMHGCSAPIYIRLGARLKVFRADDQPRSIGSISDIVIRDIRGQTRGTTAMFITGIPGHPVTGVRIEGLDVAIPGGDDGSRLDQPLQERESAYPEPYTIFGPMPAFGLVLRHVVDCSVTRPQIACVHTDQRPAVACMDVDRVLIDHPVFRNPDRELQSGLRLVECRDGAVRCEGWSPVPEVGPKPAR